jgi:hypothetical protein
MLAAKETRRAAETGGDPVTPELWLQRNLHSDAMRLRSDYPATVAALTRVFAPEEIHLEFYETLFTPEGLARLSRFTGIAGDPAFAAQRVNEGRAEALPEDLARRTAAEFAHVYRWAERTHPAIRDRWPGFAYLG